MKSPRSLSTRSPRRVLSTVVLIVLLALVACGPRVKVDPFSPAEIARLKNEGAEMERRGYRIEPYDTLLIKYPYHAEMDQETVVRPDGSITAVGVGPLRVSGMTAADLASQLKDRTSQRLKNP